MTPEKFWSRVKIGTREECWEWQGCLGTRGYGHGIFILKEGDKPEQHAHRFAYKIHHGFIPAGLNVLHTCDNPKCVNPFHLYAGTQQMNVDDMIKRNRNCRGSAVQGSKLQEHDVIAIRNDKRKLVDIAKSYGITPGSVWQIKKGLKWKHLPQPLS